MPRLAAACAAAVLTMGLASAAYAADVGGIQRSIQIWVNGDQTDAVLDVRDSSYTPAGYLALDIGPAGIVPVLRKF